MSCLIARRLVEKLKELIFIFFKFAIVKENKKNLNCKDDINKEFIAIN